MMPLKGSLSLLLIVLFVQSSWAIQKTFTATVGNKAWELASNWNPSGVPTSDDDALLPVAGQQYTVTISSQAVCRSLIVGYSPTTEYSELDLANTQNLQITSTLSIFGNATINFSGVVTLTGTQLTGLSSSVLLVSGVLQTQAGSQIIQSLTILLDNGGVMNVVESGAILAGGASIIIQDGTLILENQNGLINTDLTNVSLVNNPTGTIICQPGSVDNYYTVITVPLVNYGSISVVSGSVEIKRDGEWYGLLEIDDSSVNISQGVHTFYGPSSINGNGTLQIQNTADISLDGSVAIAQFILASGGASVTVNSPDVTIAFDQFLMLGGNLSGNKAIIQAFSWAGGNTQIESLVVTQLSILGEFTASMFDTKLVVTDTAEFESTTHLQLYNSTFLLNQGASMDLTNEILFICDKTDNTSSLQVSGDLQISYPQLTKLTCRLIVFAQGSLSTLAGTLDILTDVSCSGVLSIQGDSTVILETTGTFFVGSSIGGDGSLSCQSCNIAIFGNVTLGSLIFPSGTILFQLSGGYADYTPQIQFFNQSGSSTLSLINNSPAVLNLTVTNLDFSGGTITTNYNSQLNLQSSIVISNYASFTQVLPFQLANVALINEGIIDFYGGNIEFNQNSLIYNSPSGTINVIGTLKATQNDHKAYISEVYNYGLFHVANGGSASLDMNFRNRGNGMMTIEGQLSIGIGFFTQEDVSTSNITLGGSLQLTNPGLFIGGTVGGKGSITLSDVVLDGASMNIDSSSSLTITSNFIHRGNGTLVVDVASNGVLSVQQQCQLSGGNLVLYSSSQTLPDTNKLFLSAQSLTGTGIGSVSMASFNGTTGFSFTLDSGAIYSTIVPLPIITSITPNNGSAYTIVTITGENLAPSPLLNMTVLVRGVAVPTTIISAVQLSFSIPVGTGIQNNIKVWVDGRASEAAQWSYAAPVVASISPETGSPAGSSSITITGLNFGENASVLTVSFGSFGQGIISSVNNTQIVSSVPAGVGANVSVVVNVDQQTSSAISYSYFGPVLQAVYPSTYVVGDSASVSTISITASNLPSTSGSVTIKIGTYTCGNVSQTSATTLSCILPGELTSSEDNYDVKVDVAGQTSNALTFRVLSMGKSTTTHKWWPVPWWVFLAVGLGLAVLFGVGLAVGCVVARKTRKTNEYVTIN